MPNVELLPVPVDPTGWRAYLLNNFRRVADVLNLTAASAGNKDIEITDSSKGLILKSPNGTRYRVTVSNAGALVVTSV